MHIMLCGLHMVNICQLLWQMSTESGSLQYANMRDMLHWLSAANERIKFKILLLGGPR